jgi:hypothetical protein
MTIIPESHRTTIVKALIVVIEAAMTGKRKKARTAVATRTQKTTSKCFLNYFSTHVTLRLQKSIPKPHISADD